MDNELIKAIAQEIVNEGIYKNWLFYTIILALNFLAIVFGGLLAGYALKRGKHFATTADIIKIHEQLKDSTRIVNEIKNDIEHSTWKKQEVNAEMGSNL